MWSQNSRGAHIDWSIAPSALDRLCRWAIDAAREYRYLPVEANPLSRPGKKHMRTNPFVFWLALPVATLLCGVSGASAENIDARQACTPDAMRLCSEFIPDVPKVTACMKAKRRQLSPECRTAMAGGHEAHHGRHRSHHTRHKSS